MAALLLLAGCSSLPNAPTPRASLPEGSASGTAQSPYPALPPAGSGRGGYYLDDGPGDHIPPGLENVPDAVPRIEPYAKRGNSPYEVFGVRYVPILDDKPFTQRGYGSWYGRKFQGQKTSSGEIYDMYKMTAASPILPIPSYARVTNLSNGRQVVVRINDRGPFRSHRIIDLSYTAALKLGYLGHGSAELEAQRILPSDIEQMQLQASEDKAQPAPVQTADVTSQPAPAPVQETPQAAAIPAAQPAAQSVVQPATQGDGVPAGAPTANAVTLATAVAPASTATAAAAMPSGFYLQFGAYSEMANAEVMRSRLLHDLGSSLPGLTIEPSNSLYRIYSGPFSSREDAATAAAQAQQSGVRSFIVQR